MEGTQQRKIAINLGGNMTQCERVAEREEARKSGKGFELDA